MDTSPVSPKGMTSLHAAANRVGSIVSVMGVVTDCLASSKSRGTDYQSTFTIKDHSTEFGDTGLKVKYFRPSVADLPNIQSLGDLVILRNVKVSTWSGMTILVSTITSKWTVLAVDSIPAKCPVGDIKLPYTSSAGTLCPSSAEYRYAIALCNSGDARTIAKATKHATEQDRSMTVQSASSIPMSRQKFSLVKDVSIGSFFDLVGQVVRTFTNTNDKSELYITDYTQNNLLFNYEQKDDGAAFGSGDQFEYIPSRRSQKPWPGPYGKRTLMVLLFAPHCFHAQRHVKEGDIVLLKNVRIRSERLAGARLEGCIHTDRFYPDRVNVSVITNRDEDRVKELLERKRTYWKRLKQQKGEFVAMSPRKRQAEDMESEPAGEEEVETRLEKRKKKAKGRTKLKQQKAIAVKNIERNQAKSSRVPDINQYVRCKNLTVSPLPLSELAAGIGLQMKSPQGIEYVLPFQNICCRARVRVVDFFPPKLVDFAIPVESSEYDVLSDSGSSDDEDQCASSGQEGGQESAERRWEWRFCLLVEDGNLKLGNGAKQERCRIKLFVARHDAEFLLNMDAEDLRKNPTALAQLREKLFLLWGDLEERKTMATARALRDTGSNKNPKAAADRHLHEVTEGEHPPDGEGLGEPTGRPFDCCIKEYGVRIKTPRNWVGQGQEKDDAGCERWERRFMMFDTTVI